MDKDAERDPDSKFKRREEGRTFQREGPMVQKIGLARPIYLLVLHRYSCSIAMLLVLTLNLYISFC